MKAHEFWGVPFDETMGVYDTLANKEREAFEEECEHMWVNVSFMQINEICKHCGEEKE